MKHDVKANLTSLPGHESGKFNLPLYKINVSNESDRRGCESHSHHVVFFFGLYLRAPLPFSLREEFRSDAGVELGEPDSGSEPYSSPVLVVLPQPR